MSKKKTTKKGPAKPRSSFASAEMYKFMGLKKGPTKKDTLAKSERKHPRKMLDY